MLKKQGILEKPPTPPYLSVVQLDRLIKLISDRNFSEFSTSLLNDYGFKGSNGIIALNSLKFLGIVDREGKATEVMEKFHLRGDSRKEEIAQIVRTSYKRLFDVAGEPQNLSSDELHNDMAAQYKLTPRLLRQAVPAFLKLCEYAGLKEEGSVILRKPQPRNKKMVRNVKDGLKQSEEPGQEKNTYPQGFSPVSVAGGQIILYVPSQLKDRLLDDETVENDWKEVRTALRKFADKYISQSNHNGEREILDHKKQG